MNRIFLPIVMYLPALALLLFYLSEGISKLGSNEFIVLVVFIILGTIAYFSINNNNFIFAYLRKQDVELSKDPESNQLARDIWSGFIVKEERTKSQLNIPSFIEMYMSEHKIGNNTNIIKRMKLIQTYASISILVGVLGTFVGLVFSLAALNPENIDKSILGILAGVHTAFFTSIGGILFSIAINLHTKIRNSEQLFVQIMLKIENYIHQIEQKNGDYYVVEAIGEVKTAVHNVGRAFLDVASFSKEFKTATDNLLQFNDLFQQNTAAVSSLFSNMKGITNLFNQRSELIHNDFSKLFTYFTEQADMQNSMKQSFEQTAADIRSFAGYQSRNMDGIVKQNEKVQQSYEKLFTNVQQKLQNAYSEMVEFFEVTSAQISLMVGQSELQVDVNKELAESIEKQVKKTHTSLLKQWKETNSQNLEVKDSFAGILLQIETYFTTNQKLTGITENIETLLKVNGEKFQGQADIFTKALQQHGAESAKMAGQLKGLIDSDEALQESVNDLTIQIKHTNQLVENIQLEATNKAEQDILVNS
ncbi:MotA/TolQ/ExbB proton channel family protein [Neobacillus sp. NPDC093127]|uniref:MotA/TolQ/ExbB proton channel family protein n=1 Tax=Neobacillus sp. NPDC093127 TaxID=3364296 RepID=UPI0038150DB8